MRQPRCLSCGEGNPFLRSRWLRIGTKMAAALGLTLACHQLRQRGHTRFARGIAMGSGVLGGVVAVHNLRTSR